MEQDVTGPRPVAVRVLGPCLAEAGGVAADLTAAPRLVLARLSLSAPDPVSTEAMARALWGREVPSSARAAIANHVTRLRRALGEDAVRTVPGGYRLATTTDAEEVGRLLVEAERAFSEEDPGRAFALADQALGTWRGEPFTDLTDLDEARPARVRLAQRRSSLEDLRLAAALGQGRSGWATAEAQRLVTEDGLDEGRWVLLVRALAFDGRRAKALEAIDRARRVLGREPGGGGGRLTEVEREVLGDSPGPTRFVGRQDEVDRLVRVAGAGGQAVVRGEAGSGRSSLLAALGRQLRQAAPASGLRVASARCPVNPAAALVVLDDLLDELGQVSDRRLGPIHGFAAAVGRATDVGPVVLVVDDLHLAGMTSRAALSAAADLDRVALVGSMDADARAEEVDDRATVVDLAPSGDRVVREMAADLLGEDRQVSADRLRWLIEMSGGNPLVLECLLDRGGDDVAPIDPTTHPGPPALPVTARLRDITRRRLDQLDLTARAAVDVTAVCGEPTTAAQVAALSSDAGVTAAIGDGILDVGDDGIRFRHGAIGRAVYADIPRGRRVELHHALAVALEADQAPAARIAPHHLAAADLDPLLAVASARRAGDDATRTGAHGDAARWFERALPAARALETEGDRVLVEVLIARGDALRLAGDPHHEEVLFEAADLAMALGQTDLIGAAAIAQLELGSTTATGHLHERAAALADHAMAVVTDPDQRAQVAGAAALAHSMSGHPERCRSLFLEAEATARSYGARRTVLPHADLALAHPDDLDLREPLGPELIRCAVRADDPASHFDGLMLDHGVALQRADGSRLRTDLGGMVALADVVGDVGRRWCALICSVGLELLEDRLDDAEHIASEALALFRPISPSRAYATHASHLIIIRLAQGRVAELGPAMRRGLDDQPTVPMWHSCVALATARDDPDAARHHAAHALDAVQRDVTWLPAHMLGGRAAARLGDPELIDRYAARLRPYVDLVSWQGSVTYSPVATVLAELALAVGDAEAAEHHAAEARRRATSLASPWLHRELDQLMADG